jgi:hypothetical protein
MPLTLTDDQRAIGYAEALQKATSGKPGVDLLRTRRNLQIQFSILKANIAIEAERLLIERPDIAAEVKAGLRELPKSPEDWEKIKAEPRAKPVTAAPEKIDMPIATTQTVPATSQPLLVAYTAPGGTPPEPHPLAAPFPLIEGEEYDELVNDLKKNGLLHPIVIFEDKVLDGRNRQRGCEDAEIDPHYMEYTGNDPLGFVIAANLHRRHLDVGQRSMIAADLHNVTWGGNRRASTGVTLHEAAAKLQVSPGSVQTAEALKEADPALAKDVAKGKTKLHTAAKKAGINKPRKPRKAKAVAPAPAPAPAAAVTASDTDLDDLISVEANPALDAKCEEFLKATQAAFADYSFMDIGRACLAVANKLASAGL